MKESPPRFLSAPVLRVGAQAAGLGALCGAVAAVTYFAMLLLQQLIWVAADPSRWLILPIMALGGLLIGLIRTRAAGPELEALIAESGEALPLRRRETLWVALGAVVAVAFGGVIGPEAGLIAVTGHLSAIVAFRLGRSAGDRGTLTQAGVSGALAGFYASPAGGPVHVEGEDAAPKPMLFLAGIMGFAGFVLTAETLMEGALGMMRLPRLTSDSGPWDAVVGLGAGAAGALAGAAYLVFRHWTARALARHVSNPVAQPVIGGIAAGALCTFAPILLFSGHNEIREMLEPGVTHGAWLLVALAAGKALACALCIGSHWQGGLVFPMCFAGGAAGAAALALLPQLDPLTGVAAGMAGAAAVGVTRPIVAGLIMIFVLGGNLAVPVFVGTVVGWGLLQLLPPALLSHARAGH